MASFQDFEQQATQLSNILNGPSKLPQHFLKMLWDASEGGDPGARVERAINQLMPHLENGTAPADDGSAPAPVTPPPAPAAAAPPSFPSPDKPKEKEKKEKKEKKTKDQDAPKEAVSAVGKVRSIGGNIGGALSRPWKMGRADKEEKEAPAPAPDHGGGGGGGEGGGGGGGSGPDFESFKQQGNQLSNVFGGPNRVDDSYLKRLWDAAEGGDPSSRIDRAINHLMAELEQNPGSVLAATAGQPAAAPAPQSEKKEKKSKKDKDQFAEIGMPSPQPPDLKFGADLGCAGMMGAGFGGPLQTAAIAPGIHGFGVAPVPAWDPSPMASSGAGAGGFGGAFGATPPQLPVPQAQARHAEPWQHEDPRDDSDTDSDNDWWNSPIVQVAQQGGGCWNPGSVLGGKTGGGGMFCGW